MAKTWKRPDIGASIKKGSEVGDGVPLFKPKTSDKPGRFAETWIRVLPIRDDHPYEEFYYWAAVHFPPGQGGLPFICGRKMFDTYGPGAGFNPNCPACDVAVYGADGQGTSKWYGVMNVLVLDEDGQPEDGRVLIWACPRTVLNDLLGEIENLPTDKQDITDPETGLAVRIRRKGTGKKDTRYEISLASEPIPLEDAEEILEGLHDITASYRVLEPSTVAALLGEGGDPFEGSAPSSRSRPRLAAADDDAVEGEYREVEDEEEEEEQYVAEEEEEEEEEEKPAPKAKAAPKRKKMPAKAKAKESAEVQAKSELRRKLQVSAKP